ncbi:MAG: hypothetical protein MJ252_04495 [archaeon]|nr:hypothetical protein [archaeon]
MEKKLEIFGEINIKKMYALEKQRLTYDSKPIKKMLLFNYINDEIYTTIFDCRGNTFNIPNNNKTKEGLRLILILKDNTSLKKDSNLEAVRQYIKDHDEINQGLFHIFESNFKEFISDYNFFENIPNMNYKEYHLPLCALNGILYIGGYINSKNKKNLSLLKPKTIISLMNQNDKELSEMFGDNYRNFEYEESSHDEVQFTDIVDFIIEQINKKDTPILLYCFTGRTASLAATSAFLMKYKNWPLQFAVGYVLKLSPVLDIPSWLFTQLQRWDSKSKNDSSIKK